MGTLSAIAAGSSRSLVERAAEAVDAEEAGEFVEGERVVRTVEDEELFGLPFGHQVSVRAQRQVSVSGQPARVDVGESHTWLLGA